MESMAVWEKVLVGIFALVFLFFFGPRAKQALQNSRKATNEDWKNLLVPIILVILFVIFLIMSVR